MSFQSTDILSGLFGAIIGAVAALAGLKAKLNGLSKQVESKVDRDIFDVFSARQERIEKQIEKQSIMLAEVRTRLDDLLKRLGQ